MVTLYTQVDFLHHLHQNRGEEARVALNIKNVEVERLAEEASRLAGETKTESIRKALEERLARLRLRVVKRDRQAEVLRYLEREVWPSVPKGVLGRRLTRREEDQILGFGKEGA
jgi:antitoxin VapB